MNREEANVIMKEDDYLELVEYDRLEEKEIHECQCLCGVSSGAGGGGG